MQVPSTKSFARKVSSTGRETKGRVTKRSYKKSYEKVQDFLESRTVIVRPKNEHFLISRTTRRLTVCPYASSFPSVHSYAFQSLFLSGPGYFHPAHRKNPFPHNRVRRTDLQRTTPIATRPPRSRARAVGECDRASIKTVSTLTARMRRAYASFPFSPPGSYLSSRGIPPPSPVSAALATISPTIP